MVTVPQSPPTGKGTPLMLTTHPCPCCGTALQRWALSLYQPAVSIYWCVTCLRPVCLDPPAGPARPGVEVAHA